MTTSDRSTGSEPRNTPRTFTALTRRSAGTVSRSAPVSMFMPVRMRSWPFANRVRVVVFTSVRRWKKPLSPPASSPASRNRAAMNRAAFASPAVATRLPSIESSDNAASRDLVRSTVATGGILDGTVPGRAHPTSRTITTTSDERAMRRGKMLCAGARRSPEIIERVAFGSGARRQQEHVVQRVGPGGDAKAARHVQSAERETGDGAKDERRHFEWVAVGPDVVEGRKNQRAKDHRKCRRGPLSHGEQRSRHQYQPAHEQHPEDQLLVHART